MSLYHALAMLWATFWALVLGFGISAALQVFVSKEQMSRAFGRTNFRSVAVATGLGAASSSCSYAAAAAGRSAIQHGAALDSLGKIEAPAKWRELKAFRERRRAIACARAIMSEKNNRRS